MSIWSRVTGEGHRLGLEDQLADERMVHRLRPVAELDDLLLGPPPAEVVALHG
jgi:hypothetical protein